ncbi:hypothetical protein AMECASPLE_006757 [Ameca splendens]|uniref:Uncharacterized protein n=1 Tax=Ameca splendens TaxID=208324 RepID=A0ABV0Z9G2_9TELE
MSRTREKAETVRMTGEWRQTEKDVISNAEISKLVAILLSLKWSSPCDVPLLGLCCCVTLISDSNLTESVPSVSSGCHLRKLILIEKKRKHDHLEQCELLGCD